MILSIILLHQKANEDLSELVSSYTDDGVKNLAIAGLSNTIFSYSLKKESSIQEMTLQMTIQSLSAM